MTVGRGLARFDRGRFGPFCGRPLFARGGRHDFDVDRCRKKGRGVRQSKGNGVVPGRIRPAHIRDALLFEETQLDHHLAGGLRPMFGAFFEQTVEQVRKFDRHPRIDLVGRRMPRAAHLGEGIKRRGAEEGRPPGDRLEDQRAKGKKVGAVVDLLAHGLFGRHRAAGTEHRGDPGQVAVGGSLGLDHHFRQAKIEDLGVERTGDHDVFGLEIAVHDAFAMGFRQPFGDFAGQHQGFAETKPAGFDERGQGLAFDQLHHDPVAVVLFENIEDLHDRRMGKAGSGLGFAAQPFPLARIVGVVGQDVFDRHRPPQAFVPGAINRTHTADSERPFDTEGSYSFRRCRKT